MRIHRTSIRTRLVLAFIAVGMMTGIPMVLLAIKFNKDYIAVQLEQSVKLQMEMFAQNFSEEFSAGLQRSIHQIADSETLAAYLSRSREERVITAKALESNLLRLQQQYEAYTGIYYVDADGRLIVNVADGKRNVETGSLLDDGADGSDPGQSISRYRLAKLFGRIKTTPLLLSAGNMEWFMPPREITIEGPFVDERGNLSLLAALPTLDFDSGGFGGVVFMRVSLDGFVKRLQSVTFYDRSPIWIFSSDRRRLLAPALGPGSLDPTPFLPEQASKGLVLRNVSDGLLAYEDLEIIKDKPFMRIVYTIPSSAIFRNFQPAIYFFLVVLLFSMLAICVFAYLVSKKISRPIIELANAASNLAEGRPDARVDVKSTGEIQVLVESFNQMSSKLQSANESRASAFEVLRRTVSRMRSDREPAQPGDGVAQLPYDGGGEILEHEDAQDLRNIGGVIANLIREREENLHALEAAKKSADEANSAKGVFLATMSHEIRTPLNAVIGLADILGATALSAEQQHLVRTMEAAGGQLLQIINDVLDYSRLQALHVELTDSVVELPGFLQRLMLIIGGLPQSSRLRIGYSLDPSVPGHMLADEARLMQILTNLLGNGVKFTLQGEVGLRVSVEHDADGLPRILFCVSDTGPGIAQELRDQIFEPFKQGAAERLRPHAGSGLGLAICRRLTEAMAGTLELLPADGRGASFLLTLPLRAVDVEPGPSAPGPVELEPSRSLRVLVAEDMPANQLVIRLMLEGKGCVVTLTSNGLEAVEAFANGRFDMVILDIQMPVMDGYEAARRIRASGAAGRDVLLVALTAFTQNSDRDKALACGVTEFLSKPVRSRDIAQLIRRSGLWEAPHSAIAAELTAG
jgi:signal transduction histidine kinase/CheY-like chemotaxis protein